MGRFDINSDITTAETISSAFYTDERFFDESKEKIFARSWQLIFHNNDARKLTPFVLLEKFLDEPLLLTEDDNGLLRCVSNVCTHRGKVLIEEECDRAGIQCRYHGRRFSLDGKMLSMPEFDGVKDFPSEKDNLVEISLSVWKKFRFVSLNPIATLQDFIRYMTNNVDDFDFGGLSFVSAKDYEVRAHWALYCENYLEGFHIPYVHKSLNEELDYGNYETEIFRYSSLQTGIDKDGEIAARYFFVFPNLMFNFYPWGLSINIVKPIAKDLTSVSYLTYVNDESKLNKGAGADLETVELEDQAVVESVQKGIRSRFYKKGRYSPAKEKGTHHFHRLIAEFMNS